MKLRKLLGIGLVGKIAGLVSRAGDRGSVSWPDGILCWMDWNALEGVHYSASVIYGDAIMQFLPSTLYIRTFKDSGALINGLTEDVAQARDEFPNIQYYRRFALPSKEHQRLYLCEPDRLSEKWLGDSILDPRLFNNDYPRFFVTEKFVNGSWVHLGKRDDCSDSLRLEGLRNLIERAFPPFACAAEIQRQFLAQHVRYSLTDSSGRKVHEDSVYYYDFDTWDDLSRAIGAERQEIESKGFPLLPVDLNELSSETDFDDSGDSDDFD